MANNTEPFRLLVQRHIDNQLTEQEEQEFFALIEQEEYQLLLQQVIDEQFQQAEAAGPSIQPHRLQQMRDHILTSKPAKGVVLFTLRRMAAAAAILILLAGAVYWWGTSGKKTDVATVKPATPADVAPGKNGAVLTLADGSKVVLDSAADGIIAAQHGAQAVLKDGQLSYQSTADNNKSVSFNTMTTPNGRQFHVRLPDGTGVWLNAASSITYPTTFRSNTREVSITGEVYFEVASRRLTSGKKMPFIVKVNSQTQVEVLGTHFNINAYGDGEGIKTTLLEGKVKVTKRETANGKRERPNEYSVVLKPGEQAEQAGANSRLTIDHSPNLDQVMAWKNGLFNFNGNDIRSAINEIGRWYDLEVIYESMPEQREIVGEIQRNLTLMQAMTVLKKLHIGYRLDGKKLIITK